MSFDEEQLDPHGECRHEIHSLQSQLTRLTEENERLRKIADAAEWSKMDVYGMPSMCPLCNQFKFSESHAASCPYTQLKAEVISEKP